MKIFVKVLIGIVVLIALVIVVSSIFLTRGLKTNINMTINNVDLSKIEDGTYIGSYGNGRWANKVKVTIQDNKITDIKVTKTVMFERPEMTQELMDKVIEQQKVNVDAISGATATSKSYLKSIENALTE